MLRRLLSTCLLSGLAGLSAAVAAAPECPRPLRIAFKDSASPPGLYGSGTSFADPPGWEVEAVRDALSRLGCTAELTRLPIRRVLPSLAQDQVQLAMLYAHTPERQRSVRFPLDARGQPDLAWAPAFGRITLFGPSGSRPQPGWDGQRLPPGTRVGILDGSVQEEDALRRGWLPVFIARPDDGVAMLNSGPLRSADGAA